MLGEAVCGVHRAVTVRREGLEDPVAAAQAAEKKKQRHQFLMRQAELRELRYPHSKVAERLCVTITSRVLAATEVPVEYRWREEYLASVSSSRTPHEVIAECGLSPDVAGDVMRSYIHCGTVHPFSDLGSGGYGKILDAVWQFVKQHPDRAGMVPILRTELQDGHNFCMAGKIQRICNVLAGYVDGVGSSESVTERLGRLLPPLMAIPDKRLRIRQAKQILTENDVDRAAWTAWLEPLRG